MSTPPAFRFDIRVYYEDTDAGGVVYYANYLRYLERARTEWLRSLGFHQADLLEQQHIAFAVRSVSAEYLKSARLDDALNVVSTIESLGRAQIGFAQRIERGDDILLDAKIRVACIAPTRGKPVPMPKDIYESLKALL